MRRRASEIRGGLAEFERELIRVRTGEGAFARKPEASIWDGPSSLTDISSAKRSPDERRGSADRYRQDVWSASHYHRPIAGLTRHARADQSRFLWDHFCIRSVVRFKCKHSMISPPNTALTPSPCRATLLEALGDLEAA